MTPAWIATDCPRTRPSSTLQRFGHEHRHVPGRAKPTSRPPPSKHPETVIFLHPARILVDDVQLNVIVTFNCTFSNA